MKVPLKPTIFAAFFSRSRYSRFSVSPLTRRTIPEAKSSFAWAKVPCKNSVICRPLGTWSAVSQRPCSWNKSRQWRRSPTVDIFTVH